MAMLNNQMVHPTPSPVFGEDDLRPGEINLMNLEYKQHMGHIH